MEPSQLSSKVATLEAKVAVLEDDGKIMKGEIKHVLTEIRTAILARDNPFEDASSGARPRPPAVQVVAQAAEPAARVEVVAREAAEREPEPEPEPEAMPSRRPYTPEPVVEPAETKEPIMLRPAPPPVAAVPEHPQWTLLTIASLTAWAEEAMRRLGALRFEILLDLCEAAGHVSPEARAALSRVKELDVATPEQPPSTNETVVILRQLDALLNDEYGEQAALRLARR
ncbi:MAG: hypothetical protein KGK07_06945 [Chloroflexota bacterium]|nr:hypothetical protein [Chloroflexota bacterium]